MSYTPTKICSEPTQYDSHFVGHPTCKYEISSSGGLTLISRFRKFTMTYDANGMLVLTPCPAVVFSSKT